ncbi:MAG TPA: DUF6580 family putative transport protein [Xanthomonadales bacterium]|nr:DUF6580 family putative transport protein [Xanthomonadales bacterium]
MKLNKLINPMLIIGFAVALRLLPHPANFAPIAAMALFGGAYLNRKYALTVPLVAMFISDLFLGFHASMPLVYIGFFLTGVIGLYLAKHKTVYSVVGASLLSSILFFFLTNFNYWYATALYPKTIGGLFLSYYNALPFFRNSIVGDLLYVGLFFGAYELGLRFAKRPLAAQV